MSCYKKFEIDFIKRTLGILEQYEQCSPLELGEKYGTGSTGIASAWIMRHPANMQLIAGTMKTSRLKEICEASEIVLTREEWYRIYLAGGHILP